MSVIRELPKAPEAPAEARRMVERLCDRLTPAQLDTVRLLVTEVVTNAVRHVDRDGALGLRLSVRGDRVRVEVVDPGTGFEPRQRTADSPLGGSWGLHFLEVLSDCWGIDRGERNTVWFELGPRAA